MSHFNQRMLYGIAPPSKKKEDNKPEPRDINFSKQSHEELYNKAFILAKKLIMISIKDDFRLRRELINKIASILFVNETTSILGEDRFKGCINLAEEIVNNLFSD